MTRRANKDSKFAQIIVKAKPSQEDELRAFKEICSEQKLEMQKEVFERCIKPFLAEHRWTKLQNKAQRKLSIYSVGEP